MQQQELAQMRQRDANLTALAAIGPRKKRKVDSPGSGSGTEVRSDCSSQFCCITTPCKRLFQSSLSSYVEVSAQQKYTLNVLRFSFSRARINFQHQCDDMGSKTEQCSLLSWDLGNVRKQSLFAQVSAFLDLHGFGSDCYNCNQTD